MVMQKIAGAPYLTARDFVNNYISLARTDQSDMKPKSSPYYQGYRHEVIKLLPGHYSRVLEIGCGEGGFRTNLGTCEYWGIEPQSDPAAIARKSLFRVIEGRYQDVYKQLPEGYFDLVICNDVIEHIAEPNGFLVSIKRKMRAGSVLVGSVPNVRFIGNLFELLIMKDWQYKDDGVLDRTHLRFFTEKSLRRLFRDQGFLIEEFVGINSVPAGVFPLRLLIKNLCALILGSDTRFLQFGFRIKPAGFDENDSGDTGSS